MPRTARMVIPEMSLHVVQRGHDQRDCFFNASDYLAYLAYLREFSQRFREPLPDLGALVGVVDLVAAQALADPGLGHALRVADGDTLVLEGEIARRGRAGIEMLVQPHVGWHDHRAHLPLIAARRLALRPHQAEALA